MSKENRSTGPGREPMLHSYRDKPIEEYIISPYEFNCIFSEKSNMSSDLLNAIVLAVTSNGKDEVTPEVIREAIRSAYRAGVYSGHLRGLCDGVALGWSIANRDIEQEQDTWETEDRLLS